MNLNGQRVMSFLSRAHKSGDGTVWASLYQRYPMIAGRIVISGSQELIAQFRPIISTEALWCMWIVYGTDWLIIPWQRLFYQQYPMITLILTTHRLLGAAARYQPIIPLKACAQVGHSQQLIRSCFIVVVPTFPCSLSSYEVYVGIAILKVEGRWQRQLFYENVINLVSHSLFKELFGEIWASNQSQADLQLVPA